MECTSTEQAMMRLSFNDEQIYNHQASNHSKKTLNITFGASILSVFLLYNGFFWIAIIIDGIFCNVTPIARAAYCDVHTCSGRTPNIINTFIVQSIPWIFLPFLNWNGYNPSFIILALISLLLLLSSIFFFKDFRDKTKKIDLKKVRKLKQNVPIRYPESTESLPIKKILKNRVFFFLEMP